MIGAARAEQVAQHGDLAGATGLRERHRAIGARAGKVEAGGGGVGDEERGYRQLELIGEAPGQEGAEELGSSFYHEAADTSFGQRSLSVMSRDSGSPASMSTAAPLCQPGAGAGEGGGGAVDQARRARSEETGGRIQVAGGGEGDPDRVRGQAAGGPAGAAARVPDQQPRVVRADRVRADHDRVGGRPHLVHPVQVGGPGQDQPVRAGVVQVPVADVAQDSRTYGRDGTNPSVAIGRGDTQALAGGDRPGPLYWSDDA